jgi:hypothetical protein
VGCSLCTCKSVEERRKGETYKHALSPRWAKVHDVRMNGLLKSGLKTKGLRVPFAVYFATSPCLICFDRDRPSRLRDAVTVGKSSL